ncbi:hypothetical protein ARMGADRAFT_461009 [Armillaria gallica]|uniref:Uncharacterized protein n=1 Tax=Armillaria gallica TaxID=47427 RepID=A0A2H3D0E3_ARMGA|nr:hypothetical protein ARMGADRAFT_461009 [Armillaria gallica]
MTATPDTDMLTALHSTLHRILARLVEQKISEDVLSLTVSQFAEFYPALQEKVSVKDWEYLEVASMVFSRVDPPSPSLCLCRPLGRCGVVLVGRLVRLKAAKNSRRQERLICYHKS